MKFLFTVIFFTIWNYSGNGQTANSLKEEKNDSIAISKWVKSIIQLDSRQSPEMNPRSVKALQEFRKNSTIPNINKDSLLAIFERIYYKTDRSFGSAIYMKDDSNHYLITARHIMDAGYSNTEVYEKSLKELIGVRDRIYMSENDNNPNTGLKLNNTYLVPSKGNGKSIAFSSKEIDLAIIYLNRMEGGIKFINMLIERDVKPILLKDIDTSKVSYNQKVIVIGYPSDVFTKRPLLEISDKDYIEATNSICIPVITRGLIQRPYYDSTWISTTAYITKGNSGGALISNNKLIGVLVLDNFKEVITQDKGFERYAIRNYVATKSREIFKLLNSFKQ